MAVSTVMRSTLAVAVARSLAVAPARRYPSASSSHIPLAHALWADVLRPGDTAVDCTCGNGADAAVIAARVFATRDADGRRASADDGDGDGGGDGLLLCVCLLYTSPSPRDRG